MLYFSGGEGACNVRLRNVRRGGGGGEMHPPPPPALNKAVITTTFNLPELCWSKVECSLGEAIENRRRARLHQSYSHKATRTIVELDSYSAINLTTLTWLLLRHGPFRISPFQSSDCRWPTCLLSCSSISPLIEIPITPLQCNTLNH